MGRRIKNEVIVLNYKPIVAIFLILLTVFPTVASEFDIVRNNKYEDCIGATVKFCRENPDYVPMSISKMWTFKYSHMVAVKVINDNDIHVIDIDSNNEYISHNWSQNDREYYHIWKDEPVLRNWGIGRVLDNRGIV